MVLLQHIPGRPQYACLSPHGLAGCGASCVALLDARHWVDVAWQVLFAVTCFQPRRRRVCQIKTTLDEGCDRKPCIKPTGTLSYSRGQKAPKDTLPWFPERPTLGDRMSERLLSWWHTTQSSRTGALLLRRTVRAFWGMLHQRRRALTSRMRTAWLWAPNSGAQELLFPAAVCRDGSKWNVPGGTGHRRRIIAFVTGPPAPCDRHHC